MINRNDFIKLYVIFNAKDKDGCLPLIPESTTIRSAQNMADELEKCGILNNENVEYNIGDICRAFDDFKNEFFQYLDAMIN